MAAHKPRIAVLTERVDEMRDHLDQAGLHFQTAEGQIRSGGNMSGFVKFTFSKEMMPDSFNVAHREVLRLGVQDVELRECWR